MTDETWPSPPSEPGPWAGGPPVSPPGSSSIPPLTPGAMPPPPPRAPGNQGPGPGAGPISGPLVAPPGSTMWSPAAVGSGQHQSVYPGAPMPPTRNQDRAPSWVRALSAAVVLAVVAGGIFLVTTKESPYPSDWDPRVADLAEWVEGARELSFEHPVEVLFLTSEEYSGETTGDVSSDADLEAEDRGATDEAVGMLRALGLVEGEVDLTAANNTLSDSGTLAFYSPETETVYVRGTVLTPAVQVTLAHELVHVLQDQHFDLGRIAELESGAASTLRAMAEGDATRIEDDYIQDELTDDERTAYEKEATESYDEVSDELDDDVPPALSAFFASPYIFGPRLVDYLFATGGTAAIDAALDDPPSEFSLFDPINNDPATHLAEDQVIISVDVPEGAEAIDDGSFGSTSWYLVMAARLDPIVALTATDGITADGYVNYRQDGVVCVSAVAEAGESDLDELTSALQQWAAKSPEGSADVTASDGRVTFRSCDPGKDVTGLGTVSIDLLLFPAIRTDAYVAWIDDGATEEQAACFSQGLVEEFTVEEIADPTLGSDQADAGRIDQLAASCS